MVSEAELYQDLSVTVIAIDGASGVGKGTARGQVAQALGFHELDSGCLYRAVALKSLSQGVSPQDISGLVELANDLDIQVQGIQVFSGNENVTKTLRSHEVGIHAGVISQIPEVRKALLHYQYRMRMPPGLVADGRDMGEVYLSPNCYRYFLTTSLDQKALRQCHWISENEGREVDFQKVREDMRKRDEADKTRANSPLRMHPEAVCIDNTYLDLGETAELILRDFERRSQKK